jgi:hypothetical protein
MQSMKLIVKVQCKKKNADTPPTYAASCIPKVQGKLNFVYIWSHIPVYTRVSPGEI